MATINIYDATVLEGFEGTAFVTSSTSTKFSLSYPAGGAAIDIIGFNFTYTSGDLTGGVVTGANYYKAGALAVSFSGFNATVAQFIDATLQDKLDVLIYGGADSVFGSTGAEMITTHTGNDTIIALDGDDAVFGGAGNDDVNGNVGRDVVHGDDGADLVRGGRDNDTIYGDAGDDIHVNGNIGNDLCYGGVGNDTVYGGQDSDTLHGEAGSDLLSGDLGADILYGGAGADRFALNAGGGFDWVADFNVAEGDRIQLAAGTAYTVSSSGGQVMIDVGADHIGLAGIAAGTFSASWIVFA